MALLKDVSRGSNNVVFKMNIKNVMTVIQLVFLYKFIAVTGLLDQLGPRLFGELVGLPVACKDCLEPGLSLAYVIDTSLSMSIDFEQIKTKITETIQSSLRENKTLPSDFILSTFSDPGIIGKKQPLFHWNSKKSFLWELLKDVLFSMLYFLYYIVLLCLGSYVLVCFFL